MAKGGKDTAFEGPPGTATQPAAFGPDKPIGTKPVRAKLCAALRLVDPTDAQLFTDALEEILNLRAELAKGRKAREP